MKNLLFDFDGVLADTWKAVTHSLVAAGREPNREAAIANARAYASKKSFHTRDHTLTEAELTAEYEWIARFGVAVREHGFSLFDDFVREIEQLQDKRVAVISSGSQQYVLPAIEQTKLRPTHVLAFEDHHSKEEKIELVCRDWGIDVSEAYYFTDTLVDIYELRDLIAPEKLIAVTWGYCTKEQLLTELPPECVIDRAGQLRDVVGSVEETFESGMVGKKVRCEKARV